MTVPDKGDEPGMTGAMGYSRIYRIFSCVMGRGPGEKFPVFAAPHSPPARLRAGVTLAELMVAMVIMSVGVLGMVGAFKFFNVGIQSAKTRSLANNIAQERVEFLKNKSYYRVLVTTASASDPNFDSGEMVYDVAPTGEETVNVGGITFIRRVYIRKVNEDADGNLDYLAWNEPDPGLKEIKVYVVWEERGEWRKLEVRNLRENPSRVNLSASISGHVQDSGTNDLAGVVVRAQENPSKYGETDSAGNYSFDIEPGTYTLLAVKDAYFPGTLPSFGVISAQSATGKNFTLTQMSSGTITGTAYKRDHLVIYMVVASSAMVNGDEVEFVSLYNPTTSQINMLTDPADSTSNNLKLSYFGQSGEGQDISEFWLQHRSTFIPSGYYYLIASTGSFTWNGTAITADAVYGVANAPPCDLMGSIYSCINKDKAGAVRISDVDGNALDTLGWSNTVAGKAAPYYEGAAFAFANGLPGGVQVARLCAPNTFCSASGSCYDTNNNSSWQNFYSPPSSIYIPFGKASGYKAPMTGTPAAGAVVFTDDSLSAPVTADSAGTFNLTNVSTGSWIVYVSSGLAFSSVAYYGGASANFVSAAGNFHISSVTAYGYVTGRVANISGVALSGIKMFSSGSSQVATNASGRYTLPVTAGVVTVAANYQSQSPSYVELSSADITVGLGEVVKDVDFSLYFGGRIRGRITTNGTDPLPNIPVVGFKGGIEQGSGISDSNGYFTISGSGVSTGTYVVTPQLEVGESASPSSTTVIVEAGLTAFSSTYTISGAFGSVSGSVRTGSLTGPVITTGVLVYVTTSTLAAGAGPPDITFALRGGTGVYYAASSNALGKYSIPVKGGYSYNVYAWHTTWGGATPTTVRKESLAVSVAPAESKTADFFW